MKSIGWGILLTAALSYASIAGAQDQGESQQVFKTKSWRDDFSVAVGTKVWFNQWTTFDFPITETVENVLVDGVEFTAFSFDIDGDGFSDTFIDVNGNNVFDAADQVNVIADPQFVSATIPIGVTSHDSEGYDFVPIPVISVKYKDFFVSASYFVDTNYRFPSFGLDAERREWDVTTGYYVLPPYLALTVGYKDIEQKFGSLDVDKFEVTGPTLGFVGAVPMKWGFSLYSNFAYGFLQMESANFRVRTPTDDDRDSQYWLVEGGIAYTYDLSNLPAHLLLNSATFYAGYRHQQVETDISDSSSTNDGVDVTRGMAIGLNLAF